MQLLDKSLFVFAVRPTAKVEDREYDHRTDRVDPEVGHEEGQRVLLNASEHDALQLRGKLLVVLAKVQIDHCCYYAEFSFFLN